MVEESGNIAAQFHGDRPITGQESDQFGFAKLAERVARSLTSQAAGKGFVFGIEGKWGSGKSSLLALTLAELRKMDFATVATVEFRPWLIGDRDQLLAALFEDLAKAIATIEHARGDATRATTQTVATVADRFKSYARHLTPIGKLTNAVGLFVPGANLVGEVMKAVGEAAGERASGPTLVEQKDDLSQALLDLDCRIVIAIDDVDRLEPSEVAELLRLVRSVADFPNISYLLCYDANILASATETAMGVDDGVAYLEKIIQTEVAVPRPESFALRRWFTRELQTFARCGVDRVPDLQHVIDETGGRAFDTPRRVVRVLDSLRVFWPTLDGRVDLPDLVWLRIMAVSSPNLYRWIEEYLVAYSALAAGRAHISDPTRKAVWKALKKSLKRDRLDWDEIRFELGRRIPGLGASGSSDRPENQIFSQTDGASRLRENREKRLASPNYSRLYFTLVEPPDSVTEVDLAKLLDAAGNGSRQVENVVLEMSKQTGDALVTKAERLVDLLSHADPEFLHGWPIENLVLGLATIADQLAEDAAEDEWGYPRSWKDLRDFLKHLENSLPAERFDPLFLSLFRAADSIGFLSYLLRQETFNHGVYGNEPDPRDVLTSRDLFREVSETMFRRYQSSGLKSVLMHKRATIILYAWSQAGGRADLLPLVAEFTETDSGLVAFLKKLFRPNATLSLDGIANFFDDVVGVVRRVRACVSETPPNEGARSVIESLESNSRFFGADLDSVIKAREARRLRESEAQDGDGTADEYAADCGHVGEPDV